MWFLFLFYFIVTCMHTKECLVYIIQFNIIFAKEKERKKKLFTKSKWKKFDKVRASQLLVGEHFSFNTHECTSHLINTSFNFTGSLAWSYKFWVKKNHRILNYSMYIIIYWTHFPYVFHHIWNQLNYFISHFGEKHKAL